MDTTPIKGSTDANASAFLRAARAGNLEKVLEYLKGVSGPESVIDINISNANGLNALHLASKEGHVEMVAELLKRGANVNAATKKGNTALHIASLAGQFEIVKILVDHGADVNAQSQNGFTPLYMAAQENHDAVVRYLVDHKANPTITTEDGFTPLAVALQQGHEKVVSILLEKESSFKDVAAASKEETISNGTAAHSIGEDKLAIKLPALHIAAKKDDCKAAEYLLKNGSDPNVTSKSGFTPLHIAAHYGNENIGQLLLKHGANINFKARHDITPLHVASRWGKVEMVELLVRNGTDVDSRTRDGLTPLHCAARSGHENVLRAILEFTEAGEDPKDYRARTYRLVTAKTKNGLSPLHMASQGNHVKCGEILLRYDSPVDDITVDYLTSLHICAHYGNVETAKLLLDHNAEVDARALNGFTPLHIACKKNRLKIVELLLCRGAGIMCRTESGLTPLHVACFMGHMNVVVYLLNYSGAGDGGAGVDVDATTVRGETPLHLAARANQSDIMRILLRKGALVDCRATENQTPLHIASRLGNTDTASLLLQHGASAFAKTTEDYTPIHLAVKEGHPETLALLLEQRISTTEQDQNRLFNESLLLSKKGFAPLHLAAKSPNDQATPVARVLLEKGADVDVLGKNDVTPLHVATHYDKAGLVNVLLEHGANPLARANNGYTALHIAAKKNSAVTIASMIVAYLPKKGRSNSQSRVNVPDPQGIDCRSRSGFTPLHLAAQAGNSDMTAYLLKCGADPMAASNNGLTPMHLAAQNDNVDCMTLLCKAVAAVATSQPLKEAQEAAIKEIINIPTIAGYTPLHTACHYGRLNAVRFLLDHGADPSIKTTTSGYTPMHQAAQQGHSAVVNLLLQHNASPDTLTNQGQTALSIAQKLGYVSLIETLKVVTETIVTTTTTTTVEEKYKLLQPETMQENYISDSEDEPDVEKSFKEYIPAYYEGGLKDISGDDTIMGDTSYRYLTSEQMKSLGDDSIKLLDQEPTSRLSAMERSQGPRSELFSPDIYDHQYQEEVISPTQLIKREEARGKEAFIDHPNILKVDNIIPLTRPPVQMGFLVSFMVDARGGAMRGCRHSGVRVIIPPRKAQGPVRVTCRFLKKEKMTNPPPLIEGEGLACRVLELGPAGTKFLGPVIIEIPHYASLGANEREITILRSDNGETWREHILEASESAVQEVLNESFDGEDTFDDLHTNRITRILTNDFPLYFAIVSRIHQETHTIGPEGGIITSTIVPTAQAMFPEGALTKRIRIGLQAHPILPDTVSKMLGNRVAVSPVVTIEPRRRKFHKPITLTIPLPQASTKGMINQYNNGNTGQGDASSLRLLCSITGGVTAAQWEDITGSTPLTFINNYISFTTTVSARFWLIDCRQIAEATRFATEIYREATKVPYMSKIIVYGKRDPIQSSTEAHLRAFVVTDDRMDKKLEYDERFREIAQSREVEVIDNKPIFLEMIGNLVQITKSDASRLLEDQIISNVFDPISLTSPTAAPSLPTSTSSTLISNNLNYFNFHNVLAMRFKPFQENRLPFKVRIKDPNEEAIGRLLFLPDPPSTKLTQPVTPICTLNIVIPDDDETSEEGVTVKMSTIPDKITDIQTTFKDIEIAKEVMHPDLLLDSLSRSLHKDWELLAKNLEFDEKRIATIRKEFPNNLNHQAKAFIITWRHQLPDSDDAIFKGRLENALKAIKRNDILEQFSLIKTPESRETFKQTMTAMTTSESDQRSPAESPEIHPTTVVNQKPKSSTKKVSDTDKIDRLKQFAADTVHSLPLIPKKHTQATTAIGSGVSNNINDQSTTTAGSMKKAGNFVQSTMRKSLQNIFHKGSGGGGNTTPENLLIDQARQEKTMFDLKAFSALATGKILTKDVVDEATREATARIITNQNTATHRKKPPKRPSFLKNAQTTIKKFVEHRRSEDDSSLSSPPPVPSSSGDDSPESMPGGSTRYLPPGPKAATFNKLGKAAHGIRTSLGDLGDKIKRHAPQGLSKIVRPTTRDEDYGEGGIDEFASSLGTDTLGNILSPAVAAPGNFDLTGSEDNNLNPVPLSSVGKGGMVDIPPSDDDIKAHPEDQYPVVEYSKKGQYPEKLPLTKEVFLDLEPSSSPLLYNGKGISPNTIVSQSAGLTKNLDATAYELKKTMEKLENKVSRQELYIQSRLGEETLREDLTPKSHLNLNETLLEPIMGDDKGNIEKIKQGYQAFLQDHDAANQGKNIHSDLPLQPTHAPKSTLPPGPDTFTSMSSTLSHLKRAVDELGGEKEKSDTFTGVFKQLLDDTSQKQEPLPHEDGPRKSSSLLARARHSISKTIDSLQHKPENEVLLHTMEGYVVPTPTGGGQISNIRAPSKLPGKLNLAVKHVPEESKLSIKESEAKIPSSVPDEPDYDDSLPVKVTKVASKIPKPPGLIRLSEDEKIKMLGQVLIDTDKPVSYYSPTDPNSSHTLKEANRSIRAESTVIKDKLKDKQHLPPYKEIVIEASDEPKTPTPSPVSSPETSDFSESVVDDGSSKLTEAHHRGVKGKLIEDSRKGDFDDSMSHEIMTKKDQKQPTPAVKISSPSPRSSTFTPAIATYESEESDRKEEKSEPVHIVVVGDEAEAEEDGLVIVSDVVEYDVSEHENYHFKKLNKILSPDHTTPIEEIQPTTTVTPSTSMSQKLKFKFKSFFDTTAGTNASSLSSHHLPPSTTQTTTPSKRASLTIFPVTTPTQLRDHKKETLGKVIDDQEDVTKIDSSTTTDESVSVRDKIKAIESRMGISSTTASSSIRDDEKSPPILTPFYRHSYHLAGTIPDATTHVDLIQSLSPEILPNLTPEPAAAMSVSDNDATEYYRVTPTSRREDWWQIVEKEGKSEETHEHVLTTTTLKTIISGEGAAPSLKSGAADLMQDSTTGELIRHREHLDSAKQPPTSTVVRFQDEIAFVKDDKSGGSLSSSHGSSPTKPIAAVFPPRDINSSVEEQSSSEDLATSNAATANSMMTVATSSSPSYLAMMTSRGGDLLSDESGSYIRYEDETRILHHRPPSLLEDDFYAGSGSTNRALSPRKMGGNRRHFSPDFDDGYNDNDSHTTDDNDVLVIPYEGGGTDLEATAPAFEIFENEEVEDDERFITYEEEVVVTRRTPTGEIVIVERQIIPPTEQKMEETATKYGVSLLENEENLVLSRASSGIAYYRDDEEGPGASPTPLSTSHDHPHRKHFEDAIVSSPNHPTVAGVVGGRRITSNGSSPVESEHLFFDSIRRATVTSPFEEIEKEQPIILDDRMTRHEHELNCLLNDPFVRDIAHQLSTETWNGLTATSPHLYHFEDPAVTLDEDKGLMDRLEGQIYWSVERVIKRIVPYEFKMHFLKRLENGTAASIRGHGRESSPEVLDDEILHDAITQTARHMCENIKSAVTSNYQSKFRDFVGDTIKSIPDLVHLVGRRGSTDVFAPQVSGENMTYRALYTMLESSINDVAIRLMQDSCDELLFHHTHFVQPVITGSVVIGGDGSPLDSLPPQSIIFGDQFYETSTLDFPTPRTLNRISETSWNLSNSAIDKAIQNYPILPTIPSTTAPITRDSGDYSSDGGDWELIKLPSPKHEQQVGGDPGIYRGSTSSPCTTFDYSKPLISPPHRAPFLTSTTESTHAPPSSASSFDSSTTTGINECSQMLSREAVTRAIDGIIVPQRSSPSLHHRLFRDTMDESEFPLLLHGREGETTLKKIRVIKQTKTRTLIKDGQEETQTIEETLYDDGSGKQMTFEELDPELQAKITEISQQPYDLSPSTANTNLIIEEIKDDHDTPK